MTGNKMAKFNTMNSNISEIKTEIKIRDEKYKDLLDFTCIEKRKNVYLPHLYARGNSEITHRATSK